MTTKKKDKDEVSKSSPWLDFAVDLFVETIPFILGRTASVLLKWIN